MPTIWPIRFEKLTGVKKFCAVKPNATTTMMSATEHRRAAEVAGAEVRQEALGVAVLLGLGDDGGGVAAHACGPPPVDGIPETFVATPAVIACTISSCVVCSRS